jgi:hypothetical protein
LNKAKQLQRLDRVFFFCPRREQLQGVEGSIDSGIGRMSKVLNRQTLNRIYVGGGSGLKSSSSLAIDAVVAAAAFAVATSVSTCREAAVDAEVLFFQHSASLLSLPRCLRTDSERCSLLTPAAFGMVGRHGSICG